MERQPNYHANIMLDLECTNGKVYNPALIQLAAVHFDLDTGQELNTLSLIINLDSNYPPADNPTHSDFDPEFRLAKYEEGDEGMIWLEKNIPETLEASRTSKTTLHVGLFKFSNFVRAAKNTNQILVENSSNRWRNGTTSGKKQPQVMVWANGAVADNVWIASAYKACGMKRPWDYYNDMCVRTFMKQAQAITGRDFTDDPFLGNKHDALADCKNQIRRLVTARNHLFPPPPAPASLRRALTISSPSQPPKRKLQRGISLPNSLKEVEPEVASFMAGGTAQNITSFQANLSSSTIPSSSAPTQPSRQFTGYGYAQTPHQKRVALAKEKVRLQAANPQNLLSLESSFSAEMSNGSNSQPSSQEQTLPQHSQSIPLRAAQGSEVINEEGSDPIEQSSPKKRARSDINSIGRGGLPTPGTSFCEVKE